MSSEVMRTDQPETCTLPAPNSNSDRQVEEASSPISTPADPETSTRQSDPFFPRSPGETPRAFAAFLAFFQLGQDRSHQTVADKLGEGLPTVKNWASKYGWTERLNAYYAGLLQQQAQAQSALHREHSAAWVGRLESFREQEWEAAQKLLAAAQCFLESFGDEELHKMTLAQVSRALRISSAIGRQALAGVPVPESAEPSLSPAQQQLLDAVKRIYGQTAPDRDSSRVAAPQPPPNGNGAN